jgi:hypothetical protein
LMRKGGTSKSTGRSWGNPYDLPSMEPKLMKRPDVPFGRGQIDFRKAETDKNLKGWA